MMSQQQLFEQRINQFARARRHLRNAALGYRLAQWAFVAAAAALVLLSGWLPSVVLNLAGFVALAALLLGFLLAYPLRRARRRSVLAEAFDMENLAGTLQSRLVSAWDFVQRDTLTPLMQRVVERARQDLEFPFESRLDHQPRDVARRRCVASLVVVIVVALTPWFGLGRLAANLRTTLLAVREMLFPVEYALQPGAGQHIHLLGERVEVGLRFTRSGYSQVRLVQHVGEQEPSGMDLPVDAGGAARHTLTSDVQAEYDLHFEFGDRKTESMRLVFTLPPSLVNMQTELAYPTYTRLLPRAFEGFQQRLLALAGTRISLGFTFSKDLESATLTWDDGQELPLEILGRFASIQLLHDQPRRGTLQVRDLHGLALEQPLTIDFDVQLDEKPRVLLPRHLREDMPLLEETAKRFSFGARLQDDYGVTRCVLRWQRSTVDNPTAVTETGEIERLVSPPRRTEMVNFEKPFETLSFQPGDRISFQLDVYDNRTPGPQLTRSRRCSFFVFQENLGGLTIKDLGFGSDLAMQGRIPKASRATVVKAPEGRRNTEKVRNEFEANVATSTAAPVVRGEFGQATRDYFRLLSGVALQNEKPTTPAAGESSPPPDDFTVPRPMPPGTPDSPGSDGTP